MDRVELEKIFKVIKTLTWGIDCSNTCLILLTHEGRSEHESTNSSESIDTHLSNHSFIKVIVSHFHLDVSADSGSS